MTTPTIASKLEVLHSADGLVDLYTLDASMLGGSVYHFSPQCFKDGSFLSWGGQAYTLLPIGIDSLERKAMSTELPQPQLTVSNVGGPLLSAVVALGDLVGAKLTHVKTYVSYLDGQANPSTSEFWGPEVWTIFQKTNHTNQSITFTLSSPLDRPGFQFPIRQYLKYQGINPGPVPVFFPGISSIRTDLSSAM
jgi:lambda family phage minor tail protein L